ncbi:extracellular solute-binding protein [Psychromarinibacter sp. C21-152]|uniref:Extracellular solute-binding protein n=1 Tax=Psychromarinibacter sediminicola TaxID=3033385 RepID=A0AAE3NQW7_9RHOB|nr:extracellular solute-binding protein [Psychromarinibacter sediminicola]MDF0600771.1 extracellular solute-binding protein [Psychromarinibacter sediminicola]
MPMTAPFHRALPLALASLVALAPAAAAQEDKVEDKVTEAHGVSNFGALKYGPDFEHLDYVNPDAPKGGEISQSASGGFDSFNNFTRKGVSAALTELMYEDVLVGVADDPYGLYCYLCETLEYPESRDWVIFNLRDDVHFWDGTPMTAEDIKFTFELFMEQGITEFVNVVEGFIEDVEVLGPHRIKYTFTEDAPRRDVIGIAGIIGPFSKDWFEETGARIDESTLEPFMATGPYRVGSFDVGRQIIYERDPDFWGADHPLNVGQNNFDRIRVEYYADSAAAFEAFKAGDYTFRVENSSKQWATGYDFPALENDWVVKAELPDGTIGSGQAWVFNLRREPWQDPRVREAVRLMFNFEWANETLFYGLYERVNSFWENSELEATGTPSEAEQELLRPLVEEGLLDEAILSEPAVMAPSNEAEENLPSRRVRRDAVRLLEEAGWSTGAEGVRMKDGEPLSLVILSYSPAFDRIINPYVESLRSIGIDARLERVDIAQYTERRRLGDYDLVNHTFSMGFEPGVGLRQWYDSSTAEDSSRNLMGLENAAVDRLITRVIEASDLDGLHTAVHALDRVLRAIGFWVPQWFKDVHTVAYYDMYRYSEPLPPLALGHLSFWWYDEEAAEELRAAGAIN